MKRSSSWIILFQSKFRKISLSIPLCIFPRLPYLKSILTSLQDFHSALNRKWPNSTPYLEISHFSFSLKRVLYSIKESLFNQIKFRQRQKFKFVFEFRNRQFSHMILSSRFFTKILLCQLSFDHSQFLIYPFNANSSFLIQIQARFDFYKGWNHTHTIKFNFN